MIVKRPKDFPVGGAGVVRQKPVPSGNPLPDVLKREPQPIEGDPRNIVATQYFWLNMTVPFSNVAGEQRTAYTDQQNFPLFIRGAWTNIVQQDVRGTIVTTDSAVNWSFEPALVASLASRSLNTPPMLAYRRGYALPARAGLRGDWINGATPESAPVNICFLCERPEEQVIVPVAASAEYRIVVSLGMVTGTATGTAFSQQVQEPILIYGAVTNTDPLTQIRILDTQKNVLWSSNLLPIGAFCGIDDGTNQDPRMYYPKAYLLQPNSQIRVEWSNVADVDGGFISFFGERIISQRVESPPPNPPITKPPVQPPPQPKKVFEPMRSGDNDYTAKMMAQGWRATRERGRWEWVRFE